jgi:phosphoglycerate dehydrogenase-like enzyme
MRQIRLLLAGRNMHAMAERLQRAVPKTKVEIVVATSALEGEAHLDEVDAVVIADRVRPAYLAAPRLRWMHIVGAGVDGFSIAGLRDAPFVITHKVEASVIPMAEHVMAQILLIARRALEYRSLQATCQWARHGEWPTTDLLQVHGKTLALIGLGRTGRAIAKRARPFGLRVVGTKRHVEKIPGVAMVYPTSQLRDMLAQSDFVAILTPLTDETYHLIGEDELRTMKPTAYLINISRGPIIKEDAIIQALREGWIAGASLDVFEHEPLAPSSPLWTLPNAIITPHCGGVGPNLARESTEEIATNLRHFVAGRPLRYELNRDDIVTSFEPPSH